MRVPRSRYRFRPAESQCFVRQERVPRKKLGFDGGEFEGRVGGSGSDVDEEWVFRWGRSEHVEDFFGDHVGLVLASVVSWRHSV